MVAPQVIANRETGVTSHLPSFLRQAIQNARFWPDFPRGVAEKATRGEAGATGSFPPNFTFCCLGRTFASLIYFEVWDRPIVTLDMHAH
jgi:hypothetical protein